MVKELQGFSFLEAENTNKSHKAGKGVATLVKSQHNGCRFVLSKQLQNDLEITDSIQILISNDGNSLLLGTNISDKATSYKMRFLRANDPNSKLVLYNSAVVNEITQRMHISFEEKICVTFYGVEFFELEGKTVAELTLKGEK